MKTPSLLAVFLLSLSTPAWSDSLARQFLEDSRTSGGLVVHVGCGNGELTAALRQNSSFLVHGLDRSAVNVAAARKRIRSQGLYGSVSAEHLDSTLLPYSDNLVNLVIVDDATLVSSAEVLRVLCPRGVAYIRKDETESTLNDWRKLTKPWPDEIDEWTHYLYDSTGNAVAKDDQVGSPHHLQWTAGPKRTRDHDALSSFTTMTSSRGRLFYILDEGPTSQIHRQPQWQLVARDAFNGVLLWKKQINSWVSHLYNFRAGPVHMTRRLVSVGDRVYATLGFEAGITALDAASGKVLHTYQGSEKTEEMIIAGDVLLAVTGAPKIFDKEASTIDGYWETRRTGKPSVVKSIVAYNADSGETLWRKSDPNMAYLVPLSLTASADKAFFLDHQRLRCVDLRTGKPNWDAPYESQGLFLRNYAPTVAIYNDVIVCLSIDKMAAFSTADGSQLWRKDQGYQGFGSSGDLFIVDDLVWTFPTTAGVKNQSKDRILGNGGTDFLALDLYTGEIRQSLAKKDVWPGGHHHRCYRNKATEKFAICGRRGLEFVDLTGGDNHTINWWARGICQYGIMPCNGMVYVPPDPCRCFSTIKVDGLLALSANSSSGEVPTAPALQKGPAYRKRAHNDRRAGVAGDWPTYRRDATRSGSSTTPVSTSLERKWTVDLEATPSAVAVAQDKVFVAATDRNSVHCLNASTGEQIWEFVANGAVDSPPTISQGLAIFGSRDGHVYAVDISDGRLAWKFRAGPCDRRIVGGEFLESIWPIHGSVLVLNEVVYFAAGRSSFLNGGIRLFGLDVTAGQKRYEEVITSEPIDGNNNGALPDILVSDGTNIFMRQLAFNAQLEPIRGGKQGGFSSATGFLEPGWGHRLTWQLNGANGNLLVFDGKRIFGTQSRYAGWKKNKTNWPPTHSGHLHQKYSRYKPEWFPIGNRLFAQSQGERREARRKPTATPANRRWSVDWPMQIRLCLADNTLFAAGWPDAVTILGRSDPDASERDLQDPKLWALSTDDGSVIAEHALEGLPVFDGTAAAHGQLFLSLQNGKVICFGE